MLLALVIHYLASQAVQALPLEAIAETSSPTCDAVRTKSNIVWSCLVTIFSCTWVAIHPNIPGPDVGRFRKFLYRVQIMVLALIAPELIITWAMRQWRVARELGKKHKSRFAFEQRLKLLNVSLQDWTQTHGFFAIMGGFMLYEGDNPQHVISPKDLEPYLTNGEIKITKEEIEDKSKGDTLSKGLVIIQTSWFIMQCIARRVEQLPITELELVTLAFATLNLGTYALWWNKPLNVECAVRVYKEHQEDSVKEGQGQAIIDANRPDTIPSEVNEVVDDTITAMHKAPVGIGRRVWDKELEGCFADKRWAIVLSALLSPVWVPIYVLGQVILLLVRLAGDYDDKIGDGAKQVPTFYSGPTTDADASSAFYAGMVIASVFGGIHCVAWSFEFPSHTEQLLWRISSLTITCVPAFELVSLVIGMYMEDGNINLNWAENLSIVIFTLVLIPYIIARFTLLVLPFMALQSLPPASYQTVQWTTFIPHV